MAGESKRPQSYVEQEVVRVLRGKRGEQRVTVTALADQVGLSREQLSRILNGHKPATFSEMVDIAAALGVDLGEVVTKAQRTQAESRLDEADPVGQGAIAFMPDDEPATPLRAVPDNDRPKKSAKP